MCPLVLGASSPSGFLLLPPCARSVTASSARPRFADRSSGRERRCSRRSPRSALASLSVAFDADKTEALKNVRDIPRACGLGAGNGMAIAAGARDFQLTRIFEFESLRQLVA
jgi:hypothetical protein